LERITKNTGVRLAIVAAVTLVTGWFARGVYKPTLGDPEARENKYIRVMPIPSPSEGFRHAILIEFGVRQVNSEGFVVGIQPPGDKFRHWFGVPGRMDVQREFTPYGYDIDQRTETFWIKKFDFVISPRRSYYLCIMYAQDAIEPNDMMYFAVAANEKALLPSVQKKIGHQYLRTEE